MHIFRNGRLAPGALDCPCRRMRGSRCRCELALVQRGEVLYGKEFLRADGEPVGRDLVGDRAGSLDKQVGVGELEAARD